MDNINYEDFKKICRVCISDCGINFTKDHVILDIFHKLTDIHFDANNELPQQICRKCFEFINEIHAFSVTCKRSHSALMKCLNNCKIIQIKEEPDIMEETNEEMELHSELTIEEHKIEFVNVKDELDNDLETNDALNEDVTESTINFLPLISTNIQIGNEESMNVTNSYDLNKDSNSADSECSTSITKDTENECKITPHSSEKKYKRKNSSKHRSVPESSTNAGKCRYKCNQCEKFFNHCSALKVHERVHSGKRPYKCDQCEKSFTQLDNLNKHKRVHSGERPYKCDQCGKSFNQLGNLKTHKHVHNAEYPYKCDQCGKSFNHSGNLKTHKYVHSGEHPYKCDQCEKSFIHLGSYKIHTRLHSGEQPYKCDLCGKSFTQVGHLTRHKRVHTGEHPYKCDQCGKSFTESGTLKVHKRIHNGEHAYTCDQCGKSFNRSGSLTRHKRLHCR